MGNYFDTRKLYILKKYPDSEHFRFDFFAKFRINQVYSPISKTSVLLYNNTFILSREEISCFEEVEGINEVCIRILRKCRMFSLIIDDDKTELVLSHHTQTVFKTESLKVKEINEVIYEAWKKLRFRNTIKALHQNGTRGSLLHNVIGLHVKIS